MKIIEILVPEEIIDLLGSEDAARKGAREAFVFDLVRRTLDWRPHVYSWRNRVRQVSRSRASQWSEGSRRPPVSEVITHDDRAPILPIRAKAVSIPSGGSCQRRDGPMQHRQRPDELLSNPKRKAA
jgi:hypothetical protein